MVKVESAAVFTVKAFSADGSAFHRTYGSEALLSVPSITRAASQPSGDLDVTLAMPHDQSGYGTELKLYDRWDVYMVPFVVNLDGTQSQGQPVMVYRGTVEEVTLVTDAQNDHVSVRLFPVEAALGRSMWRHGGSYAFSFTAASVEIMLAALLADLNAAYPSVSPAALFPAVIPATGVTGSLSFDHLTYHDALTTIAGLLPATWWWRFDPDGTFRLGQWADSTADASLSLGATASELTTVLSALDQKNKITLGYSGGDSEASDSASIAAYGLRQERISQSGTITDSGTAATAAAAELALRKPVAVKATVTANAAYPIASLMPGMTLALNNTNLSSVLGVMRISQVTCDGATAVLQCFEVTDNLGKELGIISK